MTTIEEIRDIFAILHDGTISGWTGDKGLLTLTIDCEYLAQRINKSFDKFFVDLTDVDLCLSTWPNPIDLPVKTLTEPFDIFKAELEILSSEIKDNHVIVDCNQHDTAFDYCGGNLIISCKAISIYDQNRKPFTIDSLDEICKSYWNEWNKK